MSETNNNDAPDSSAANSATDSGTDTTRDPAIAATDGSPSQENTSTEPKPTGDAAQDAVSRALHKRSLAAAKASEDKPAESGDESNKDSNSSDTSEQAKGTQTDGSGDGKEASTADESGSDELTAPQEWPEDLAANFNSLPADARQPVMDFVNEVQTSYTQATQLLSDERDKHADLFKLDEQFSNDPQAVIEELARRANIDVFFNQAEANGEIPEFQNTQEMVEFFDKRAQKQFNRMLQQRDDENAAQSQKDATIQEIRRETEKAREDHPDFNAHSQAVFQVFNEVGGNINVEQAYRLATYESLANMAIKGQQAQQELDALKATVEKQQKQATAPSGQSTSGNNSPDEDKTLSPGQRAIARARERLSRQRA